MKDFFFVLILFVAGCMSCFGQDEWCQYGIIDGTGNVLVPFEYDNIYAYDDNGEIVVALKKNGFSGLASVDGDILVPCEYDNVFPPHDGMAEVTLDGKYGFVDTSTGKLVIPCIYPYQGGERIEFSDGVVVVTKGKKHICLDKKGKQLFVLGVEYNWCGDFQNGYAEVGKGEISEGGLCQYAVIDKSGKEVINYNFDEKIHISKSNAYGMACFESLVDNERKSGLINRKGEIVLPCIYDYMYDVGLGKEKDAPIFIKKDGKEGFLDAKGNELIKMEYNDCTAKNGFIIVKKDRKYGCFNYKGKEILPCIYNDISFSKNGKRYIIINANGTEEYLDENGHKIKVDKVYSEVKIKSEMLYYGIENAQGELIVPCIYRELKPIADSTSMKREKYGKSGYYFTYRCEWYGKKPTFIARKAMR